ncbi:predicted protein [Histoplasma capsulatum H143]|uniref:Uncharacterized protein n=1 Tax=Ajellomyces capsulatus (strain H143) TaxID=544712 RepID=C6H6E1_AJECH|nr:predicted protein [Histoplasma capsulatum H143]
MFRSHPLPHPFRPLKHMPYTPSANPQESGDWSTTSRLDYQFTPGTPKAVEVTTGHIVSAICISSLTKQNEHENNNRSKSPSETKKEIIVVFFTALNVPHHTRCSLRRATRIFCVVGLLALEDQPGQNPMRFRHIIPSQTDNVNFNGITHIFSRLLARKLKRFRKHPFILPELACSGLFHQLSSSTCQVDPPMVTPHIT